jgi:ubiquitin-conjugating enzyme E2 J1
METDAKGQLGGLECSKAERERIAEGSGNWKCGVCAKNNREILAECEEAVKEKEREGQQVEEVAIPSELKMGYKDEMGKGKEAAEEPIGTSKAPVAVEGIVNATDGASDTIPARPYPPARPGQTVPQPTSQPQARIQPLPIIQQNPQAQAQLVHGRSNDGVPMWIDRAIAGVVILLVAMVLKILLGL